VFFQSWKRVAPYIEKNLNFKEEEQRLLKKSEMENSDDSSILLGEKKRLTKTHCNDIGDVEYEVADISRVDNYYFFLIT